MIIVVKGKPIAKARPRFCRVGKGVRTYDCQTTESGEFKLQVMDQYRDHDLLTGPIDLDVCFYLPRPKGHYGTGRNAGTVKASAPQFPAVKPDADNYLKFVKDCLNGLVWKDDGQVVKVTAEKRYTTRTPRTVIHIKELSLA